MNDRWHVFPTDEVHVHVLYGEDCPCRPRLEPVHSIVIVVHNSFDGREAVEWANDILKPK
jgi:hypothetical protein